MHKISTRVVCVWLRVVPHLSSGIVERAKRERAWKSPQAKREIFLSSHRVSLSFFFSFFFIYVIYLSNII